MIGALIGAAISGIAGAVGSSKSASAQKDAAKSQAENTRYMFDTANTIAEDQYGAARNLFNGSNDRINSLISGYGDTEKERLQGLRGYNSGLINNNTQNMKGQLTDGRDAAVGALNPYAQSGQNALAAFMSEFGLGDRPKGYSGYEMSDGAQYLLNEGRRNIEGQAAATGGLYSGNTMAEMERMRAGTVAQDRNTHMNALMNLINGGQSASSQIAGIEGNYGTNMAGVIGAAGDKRSANQTGYLNSLLGINSSKLGMQIGQEGQYAQNMGTAIQNRANLQGTSALNYGNTMNNVLANQGNAAASGYMGMANAVQGGVNNWMMADMLRNKPADKPAPAAATTPIISQRTLW